MEYQEHFRSLKNPSITEQVEFQKRKQQELDRRRKAEIDKIIELDAQAEPVIHDEIEIIEAGEASAGATSAPEDSSRTITRHETDPIKLAMAKLKVTRMTIGKIQAARKLGLDEWSPKGKPQKAERNDSGTDPGTATQSSQASNTKGKRQARRPTELSNKEIRSIFENTSASKSGKDPLPPGFVSTEKNKQKAFGEMLANIPTKDKHDKRERREEISILDEATKTFNPSARRDEKGKWKVRGLETPLMVNQVRVLNPYYRY
jgi:hypothetical protein